MPHATPANTIASVLVVEDDPQINSLIGAYAQICQMEHRAAFTGEAALREVSAHPPGAIILDVMLPDADGFEICRRLQANPATRDIPIVILSAIDEAQAAPRMKACGGAKYMTKPFDPQKLMDWLRASARPSGEGM